MPEMAIEMCPASAYKFSCVTFVGIWAVGQSYLDARARI